MKPSTKILALVASALAIIGCSKYDDTAIRNDILDLQGRVLTIENWCKQVNSNISSLRTLVDAMQNDDRIVSVSAVEDEFGVIGYTITFTKHAPVTIYNGKDGKDGANGKDGVDGKDGANGKDGVDGKDGKDGADGKDAEGLAPVIGVRQDTDGNYYWTLNGEWLLDEAGNKIKANGNDGADGKDGQNGADGKDGANGKDGVDGKDGADGQNGVDGKDGADGKDGITPQLKIEEGYWYISYDNGTTWKQLGKAQGENGADGKDGVSGDSVFKSVQQTDDEVIFTLTDGTVIKIPKAVDMSAILSMVQSIIIVPRYTDGFASAYCHYDKDKKLVADEVEVSIRIKPESLAEKIVAAEDAVKVEAVYTQTRADGALIELPVESLTYAGDGVIDVVAKASPFSPSFFDGIFGASICVSVTDGMTDVCSDFVGVKVTKVIRYYENGHDLGIGVTIDGVTWAPVNCGYTPENKFGLLFQWGRNKGQGYGQPYYDENDTYSDDTNPSVRGVFTGENGADKDTLFYRAGLGTDFAKDWIQHGSDKFWNNGTEDAAVKGEFDPCPDGWRIPTATEIESISKGQRSSKVTVDGVPGYWFTGSVRYSESVPTKIFLPSAGYRTKDSMAIYRGSHGAYWSSTVDGDNAMFMEFSYLSKSMVSDARSTGCSVRCVQQ